MAKSFRQSIVNPAMQFIDAADPAAPREAAAGAETAEPGPPEGYRLNPLYIEKKTRRMQVLLQPSLYKRIKARADAGGESVNEVVHAVLDMHV